MSDTQTADVDQLKEDGSIERLTIDTIRTLSMDAVQKANSGHPGTPMALAPVGYTLWSQFLRYDPSAPTWPNRDRFVLSVGHASMLLYSLIHLAGIEEVDGTGKKTGTLDTSPKYADLPAPEYHVTQSGAGVQLLPEPLYNGEHEIMTNPDGSTIDLTEFQNQIEKAKASGLTGATYDDPVNTDIVRDYIDAHRKGMADVVPGLGTVPSLNMTFEKAYTWALPAIVGGIALAGADGNAWGVFNNVNDRFKACSANYPVYDPSTNKDGDKVSLLPCLPTQESGTGFSYTIEHEAAHNLGLSHPHDGSYGVERCPDGDPNAGGHGVHPPGPPPGDRPPPQDGHGVPSDSYVAHPPPRGDHDKPVDPFADDQTCANAFSVGDVAADGTFSLFHLWPGSYQLVFYKADGTRVNATAAEIPLAPGQAMTVDSTALAE